MARSGRRSVTWWAVGVVGCLVVAAFTGLGGRVPAMALRQSGHWVYNSTIGAVVHVNGASKNVDSTMPLPGLGPADQVVQDDQNGYVIDRRGGRILVFGKSTLSVGTTLSAGTSEQPIALEVPGGPYLVYSHSGTIVRLGPPATTIATGGPLATPVATTDGTVWLQRTSAGAVCKLAPRATSLTCPARTPAGHRGTLTTIDDQPAFIDQDAGAVRMVDAHGLSPATAATSGLPAQGKVAASDAGGRLPVVTPAPSGGGSSLVLVDTSTVHSGLPGAAPITVPLGGGRFDAPITTGAAVVVVNQTARQIVTYTSQGARKDTVTVPASPGRLHVSRGEDGRIYIDNGAGSQTYIVDGDGSVTRVDTSGGPSKPSAPPGPPTTPPAGPPAGGATRTSAPPQPTPSAPSRPTPTPPAGPGPSSAPPSAPAPPPTPTAQVPDAPATVTATPGDGQVTVTWTTPGDNGSGLINYLVSWSGGSVTVPAGQQQTTVSGLTNGTSYALRVAARNDIGLGPATGAAPVTPTSTLHAPASVTARTNSDGTVSVSWPAQSRAGVRYTVTTAGRTIARTTGTRATATALTLGRSYRFIVAASDGTTSLSATSAAVTPYKAPGAPTGLQATSGRGRISLSWTAPPANGSRITGYTVTGAGTHNPTGTSLTVSGLRTGQTYTFHVRAVGTDPNGGSTRVTGPAATISAAPITVTVPALTIDDTSVNDDNHLVVVVDVDAGGDDNSMCRITFLGVTQDKPCPHGQDTLVHDGVVVGQDNGVPVTVTPHNAAGDGDTQTATLNTGGNGNHGSNSVGARGLPPARVRRRTWRYKRETR